MSRYFVRKKQTNEGLIRQTLEYLKSLITIEEQQEDLNYLAVNISSMVESIQQH